MTPPPIDGKTTREVVEKWFSSLKKGDIQTALSLLDDDVEWINYQVVPGFNDAMPWIGAVRGPAKVLESFKIFTGVVEVRFEECVALVVEGEDAMGVVHEISKVRKTGLEFEIEFIQWMKVRNGKIVRWKSYTDPSPILKALKI